jgi:16S rRNA (cytosine1402-N4)-methyltransferase
MTATAFDHDPVMCDEIVAAFANVPAGVIVDATLGGGGHSEALLQSRPDVDVIGLDRDPAAIECRVAALGPIR